MSRIVNKTYGRNAQQQTAASKAFDDILATDGKPSSAKASSTIKRWGGASFTSTRVSSPSEFGSRKRKLPDDDEFGDDIFSFDSDDEGPSKPTQGMGYKVPVSNSQKSSAIRKKPADGYSNVKKKTSVYPAIDAEDGALSKSKANVRSKVPVVNSVQSSAVKRSSQMSSYAFHSDDDNDDDNDDMNEPPSKLKQSGGYGGVSNSQKARTLKKNAQISYAFDSDDEGPSKPPQGMGYKLPMTNAQKSSSRKKTANAAGIVEKSEDILTRIDSYTSAKLRTYTSTKTCVSNGPETEVTHESEQVRKSKPTLRTYSRNNKVSSSRPSAKSAATTYSGQAQKQMPIETYMTAVPKQSVTSTSSKLLTADKTAMAVTRNSQTSSKRNKRFFTSQSNTMEDHNYFSSSITEPTDPPPQVAYEDHNYSQGIGSTGGSNAGSSDGDGDGDFDFYFNIEEEPQSGDPEIIFNSPKKREREAALRREHKLGLKADSTKISELSGRNSPFGFGKSLNCDSGETALSTKDSDTDSLCSEHSSQGSTSRNGSGSRILKKYHRSKKVDDEDDTNSLKAGSTGSSGAGSDYRLLDRKRSLDTDRTTKTKKPLIRRLLTSPRKGEQKATYNVRQWHAPEEDQSSNAESQKSSNQSQSKPNCPDLVKIPPRLRRVTKCPRKEELDRVTALKVGREHKGLFTVVQRVKQAHECQEHGETQEFEDDIDYIMDGLDNTQPVSVRCLSSINLATKCTTSGFRMHLRAHGTVAQIFSALNDAPDDPDLALCTAAVMFMLSRDRLNMDLDQSTLQLMVRLLSADNNSEISSANHISSSKEFDKIKEKIQGIVETLKKESGVNCVELEDISTGHLAMETLLSLTSTLAGDWFKEELRILGGLDHIVNTIHECVEELDECIIDLTQSMIDRFRKIGRCLRVLENVTYLSPDNQNHLLCYKSSLLVNSLCRCLKICENVMPFNEVEILTDKRIDKECPGYTVFTCLLYLLRVLLNLTHDNEFGSTKVGQQERLVKTVLICVLRVPQFVPSSERFDLQVLGLGLLTNMVENCDSNRRILVESHTVSPYEASALDRRRTNVEALEALSMLFNARLEAARFAEYEHDEELEAREKEKQQRRQRRICGIDNNSMETDDPKERSGMWKESDSGLEWVVLSSDVNPDSQDTDDSQEKKDKEVEKQIAEMDSQESDDDLKVEVVTGPEEDENFMQALHKAGKHMEDSIVAAYVALLVGCVIQHNEELVDRVRDSLPEGSFESMIRMLKKFLGFMNFTAAGTIKGGKSIRRIIDILEAY